MERIYIPVGTPVNVLRVKLTAQVVDQVCNAEAIASDEAVVAEMLARAERITYEEAVYAIDKLPRGTSVVWLYDHVTSRVFGLSMIIPPTAKHGFRLECHARVLLRAGADFLDDITAHRALNRFEAQLRREVV